MVWRPLRGGHQAPGRWYAVFSVAGALHLVDGMESSLWVAPRLVDWYGVFLVGGTLLGRWVWRPLR